jgi:tetratricopeptide (TPR) repeat protein
METCADARAAKPERIAACTQAHDLAADRQVRAYALWYRSDAKLETGDFAGAVADSDEADLLLPDDPAILNGRCWTRAVANWELELARGACDLSINKQVAAGTFDSRGLLNLREGKWQAAWDDYNEAFTMEPTLTMSLYGRGLAAVALGLAEDGERDMRRAASAAPDFARYGLTPESVKKRAAEIPPTPSN